jgi:hypothetical protein
MSTPYKFSYYRISNIFIPLFYRFKNLALLKIGLSKNNRITKSEAFIDTGSQYCLFNNVYARYLGIEDFKKVEKDHIVSLMGIGGGRDVNHTYFHKVDLIVYIEQRHLKRENAVIVANTEVGFLEKDIDVGAVLGVYGFLDRFSFKTNIRDGYFVIPTQI